MKSRSDRLQLPVAAEAELLDDMVVERTGPTPEEMVHKVTWHPVDDIAEVLRRWLEGNDHAA
ncbi:MAG: hypothetical protein IT204_16310 [Fimbriimonadaceae bacterium]|nr:hypothetical protein [Fimbriimonadaceae bacterium]